MLVSRRLIVVAISAYIVASWFHGGVASMAEAAKGGYGALIEEIKKTVVFLGRIDAEGKPQFYATGFLVTVQDIFHLVTAKHVVADLKTGDLRDTGLVVFLNAKGGGIQYRSIEELRKARNVKWVFHKNPGVDIAMIPFGIDQAKDDVKVIPDQLFLSSDRVFELYDVFFVSYQPGIEPGNKIAPIVRGGMVSIINADRTIHIDGSAFPGNSGSPVFLKPSPIRFDEGGISIGGDPLGGKFIGIIGEYITYHEVAISTQTGRPRVVFEENTGLSKVWTADFIQEIMTSAEFQQQVKQLLAK